MLCGYFPAPDLPWGGRYGWLLSHSPALSNAPGRARLLPRFAPAALRARALSMLESIVVAKPKLSPLHRVPKISGESHQTEGPLGM